MDFATLRPVNYNLKMPEITPTMKRMADVMTLADLMDAREKQKTMEELSGKLGGIAAKSYNNTSTVAPGLNFPLKFDPNTFYAQQGQGQTDTQPEPQGQGQTDTQPEPQVPQVPTNPRVTVETPELLDAQNRVQEEMLTQAPLPPSDEGYFEPRGLNFPLKFDPNKFYSDQQNLAQTPIDMTQIDMAPQETLPDIITDSAPEEKTSTGVKSTVKAINPDSPYEPDFMTFTPQEKAILNQAYQYGFDYGQPIYEKMLANKKLMAETYKLQQEGVTQGNKPEDETKKFKLEASKHLKITNMLQQATTPADFMAAVERAREYGFNEDKLPIDQQKIENWIAEDQGIQQQLSMLRKDVLTGAKGKFPSITIKGQTIQQPTQGEFYAAKMLKGDAPPDFSFVKGRGQDNQIVINDIWANLQKMDPNFSPALAQADYKYWTTPKTKQQRQAIDAFVGLAQKAKEGADEFKNSGIKLINGAILRARLAAGDVGAAKYISQMGVLVEDLGKAVAGGNAMTDDQLKFASSILAKDYTPDQLKAAIDMALTGAMERKYSIYSQSGIYGRNNAVDDPFLTDDIRDAIINGRKISFNEKSPAIKSKNSSQVNNVKEFVTDPKTGKLILKKVGK